MIDTDVAWAAGLFEGEGSWLVHQNRRYGGASVTSTDRDVLDRFHVIVGFGTITTQRMAQENWKTCYSWHVWNASQVQQLVEMFWPFLGKRRRARAQEVLSVIKDVGSRGRSKYQTHCKRGHEFTDANTIRQKNELSPKGWTRKCRQCDREQQKARYRSRKSIP